MVRFRDIITVIATQRWQKMTEEEDNLDTGNWEAV